MGLEGLRGRAQLLQASELAELRLLEQCVRDLPLELRIAFREVWIGFAQLSDGSSDLGGKSPGGSFVAWSSLTFSFFAFGRRFAFGFPLAFAFGFFATFATSQFFFRGA